MEFCPKCNSLLMPTEKDGKVSLACSAWSYKKGADSRITVKEKIKREDRGKGAVDKEESTIATVKEECPKCKNGKAYWWTEQTRASDEPETQFYRCTKCRHTWREYN